MNRKQKIIVSVTGIFLVLLIIVGLTYAYFLTQIKGNTNNKSISVTTANLILTYGDGNGVLETGDKLRPGNSVNFKTSSGTTVNEKTFTVTNSGDDTSYVVIVDNVNVTPEPFESNDFRYTLTCTSSDGNKCDGTTDSIFPLKNQSILVGNKIAAGVTHTYTLTMEYKETGENQSNDMGKTFTERINIEDIRRLDNPYSDNENSLAYNIINNAKQNKNGTTFVNTPETNVAESISSYKSGKTTNITVEVASYNWTYAENEDDASSGTEVTACTDDLIGMWLYDPEGYFDEAETTDLIQVTGCDGDKPMYASEEILHEKTLSVTQDDDGTNYYFRGNVEDNYLNFAGMCWRIVRIDGNNNIKIVLEDQNTTCDNAAFTGNWNLGYGNYGYDSTTKSTSGSTLYKMNYLEPKSEADKSMAKAFYDYQSTLYTKISTIYINKTISDYLVSGNWCMADTAYSRSGSSSPYTYSLLTDTNSYYLSKTSFYYDSYVRLRGDNTDGYNPTLKCTGQVMDKFKNHTVDGTTITTESDMYVGALTADEIIFAGGKVYSGNANYYLVNDYQESDEEEWWSLSPSLFGGYYYSAFGVSNYGIVSDNFGVHFDDYAFRPAVILSSGVEITGGGNGTKDNPYVIK